MNEVYSSRETIVHASQTNMELILKRFLISVISHELHLLFCFKSRLPYWYEFMLGFYRFNDCSETLEAVANSQRMQLELCKL